VETPQLSLTRLIGRSPFGGLRSSSTRLTAQLWVGLQLLRRIVPRGEPCLDILLAQGMQPARIDCTRRGTRTPWGRRSSL